MFSLFIFIFYFTVWIQFPFRLLLKQDMICFQGGLIYIYFFYLEINLYHCLWNEIFNQSIKTHPLFRLISLLLFNFWSNHFLCFHFLSIHQYFLLQSSFHHFINNLKKLDDLMLHPRLFIWIHRFLTTFWLNLIIFSQLNLYTFFQEFGTQLDVVVLNFWIHYFNETDL